MDEVDVEMQADEDVEKWNKSAGSAFGCSKTPQNGLVRKSWHLR